MPKIRNFRRGRKRAFKARPRINRKVARKPRYRNIARVVKRILSRQAEKKSICYSSTISPGTLQSTTGSLVGNMIVINPCQSTYSYTLSKGTADNERIGNNINIKNMYHSFAIYPTGYNVTTNTQPRPVIVRLYYFKSKWSPVADVATGNLCGANANFFDNSSSDTGFSGALLDMTRKIQSENYTYLCHRTYKIGNAQPVYGGASVEYYPGSNNDFKMSALGKVNLARFCKSKYRFNDANQVTTPWIFCVAQVVCADGSVLSGTQSLISMQSQIMVEYTDE